MFYWNVATILGFGATGYIAMQLVLDVDGPRDHS